MNLHDNDFELFGLPLRFAQDSNDLTRRWKELQAKVHPDRFAAQGASAQRVAMQWSARVNEAYQRLRDPLKRAASLCALKGAAIEAESNTAMPAEFLMQQMQWREALDEAHHAVDFLALSGEVKAAHQRLLQDCERALDVQGDAKAAAQHVRALMFLQRILHEADEGLHALST